MGSREQREEENTSSEKPNRKHKQINKMAAQENKPVSTVVRDDFFNDPFVKDWWSDFDAPMQQWDKSFQRQISETPRKSMLDSFFTLREKGRDAGGVHAALSGSSQSSSMQLKHGKFSVTVDIQDFDPEDIDIKVEGDFIVLVGNREIKRGNSFSVRQFNQRFPLPSGIDVSKLSTEVTGGGQLVISAPQLKDDSSLTISQGGDVDMQSSSENRKTTSEAAFEVEGGTGKTKKEE